MSSVLYGRGTHRQGDVFRQRAATVSREVSDLADDVTDLRAAVAEMNKVLLTTVARLEALEAAAATAATAANATALEAPTAANATALRGPTSR